MYSHYHTAGLGLIFVGAINSIIAVYSLSQGSVNSFIDYELDGLVSPLDWSRRRGNAFSSLVPGRRANCTF